MRVVSGQYGGRKLVSPDGEDTRPTSERVREAMFNSLFSLGAIEGARVLDAFAGSGALGFEALSRGAREVTFVERRPAALNALRGNIQTLGVGSVAKVIVGDALAHLRSGIQYDLVLLDPPYDYVEWPELLDQVNAEATVVIESDRSIDLPASWMMHREKRYGTTVVTLATASSQGDSTP